MPRHTYHPADLQPLTGATRVLDELAGMPCIEIRSAGEAFTRLAAAGDVPLLLRRYYAKVGKKLTETELRLKQNLRSCKSEGAKLSWRIESVLDRTTKLTEEDLNRLRYVNQRLQDLERILQQMIGGIHERLEGFDLTVVEWDSWDGSDIILWLEFSPDAARPAYNADAWAEDGMMEPLEIRVKLWSCGERRSWGLDDGKNHSDLGGCEGSPMQHFHQCYLFHELWDHADVGTWGMLHLRSIWIEIIPHRSGDFNI